MMLTGVGIAALALFFLINLFFLALGAPPRGAKHEATAAIHRRRVTRAQDSAHGDFGEHVNSRISAGKHGRGPDAVDREHANRGHTHAASGERDAQLGAS